MVVKKNIIFFNNLTGALLFKSTSYSYRPWESYTVNSISFMSIYLTDIIIDKLPSLSKIRIFSLKDNWISNDLRFTFESFNTINNVLEDSKNIFSCLVKKSKYYLLNNKDLLSLLFIFSKICINNNKILVNNNYKLNDSISLENIVYLKKLNINYNSYNLGCFNITNNYDSDYNYGVFNCFNNININIINNTNNIVFFFGINIRLYLPTLYINIIKHNVKIFSFFSNYISSYDIILYNKINFIKILNITNNNSILLNIIKGNHPLLSKFINLDNNISIIINYNISNYKNILNIFNTFNNIKLYYIYNTVSNLTLKIINIPFINNFYLNNFFIKSITYDFYLNNFFDTIHQLDYTILKTIVSIFYLTDVKSFMNIINKKNIFLFIKILPSYETNNWYFSAMSKIKFFKALFINNTTNYLNLYHLYNCLNLNIYSNLEYIQLNLKTTFYNYKNKNNIINYIYNYKLLLLNFNFINFKTFLGLNYNLYINYDNLYINHYDKHNDLNKTHLNNNSNSLFINKLQTTLINFKELNLNSVNIKQKNSVTLNLLNKFKENNKINFQCNL